jgi:hypothetical protein
METLNNPEKAKQETFFSKRKAYKKATILRKKGATSCVIPISLRRWVCFWFDF